MKDINLFETGSGGDIAIVNDDILLCEQLYQQAYLALFGGNIEAVTTGNEAALQYRQDWWANALLFANNPAKQFNSITEKTIKESPLNSKGRLAIISAVQTDLQYLKNIAEVQVNVVILSTDKLQILINISQPQGLQSVTLQILWDSAKTEFIIDRVL